MLDYLFIAETHNGNLIKQDQNDTSIKDTNRSAFYDVLQEKVKKFSLIGKGHIVTIDLEHGHAEIDGRIVYPPRMPPEKVSLELIYYRQVQQNMTNEVEIIKGQFGEDISRPLPPKIRYFIGWQANLNGKNYKFELGID